MERTESSAYNPNIEQKKAGVKKEQVKGCGSVNCPLPAKIDRKKVKKTE